MIHSRLMPTLVSAGSKQKKKPQEKQIGDVVPTSTSLHIWTTSAPLFSLAKSVFTHTKDLVFQFFYDSTSDLFAALLDREKPQCS